MERFKHTFDLWAMLVIEFSGMIFVCAGYLIATGQGFTLSKSMVGIMGIVTMASGGWLFARAWR